ncbi:MAG TPA: GAF domain-containing protein [Anaerolineales bacterium]|nr:GAF domain-containing protein [Anaerolineales bacterium]HNE67066.1 GAF domain-containing protein [Anaerolineales bacterium]HNJ12330.1 GAF domain-containing protein [Anaerolineales bacterium]HNO85858.1 GAF domain-containing protein [Anaerolineales bacterium]
MNQPSENLDFSYTRWQASFLQATLIGACVFGLLAIIPAVLGTADPILIGIYIGAYIALLLITILPAPYTIKAVTLVGLLFLLGISGLLETGIRGDARLFMLAAVTMATLLLSWRAGWIMTGLSMASFIIAGWLIVTGAITISSKNVTPGNFDTWISAITAALLLEVVIVNGIRLIQVEFESSRNRVRESFQKIEEERNLLEDRVKQRTQDLGRINRISEHRAQMFQTIAQVTRAIISTQNLQDLLPQIAQVISQQFGFYHVGIFLLDSNKEYAVLSATNSEGGQRMINRDHKLRIGQTGIVGNVAGTGKPRIALDTGLDATFFNNPDLPETRSEIALPLFRSGQELIGVLDVQSTESNAFTQDDIQILTTLADQVSIAIANARSYEETQTVLLESQLLYRRNIQAGWSKFVRSQKLSGIRKQGLKSSLLFDPMEVPGAKEVVRSGTIYKISEDDQNTSLTIPMKLRGEVVGLLNIKTEDENAIGTDELDIINAIVERAALSIDNARLLAESRKTAEKERVIGEISSKVSSFTNRDNILQAAVAEIGRALPGAEVVIQLQKKNDTDS